MNGVTAADAFNNALGRIADRLIDMALNAAFPVTPAAGGGLGALGGGAGGGLGGLLGSLGGPLGAIVGGLGGFLGFASGTANTGGRRGEPRGIVHGQEAVIPLPAGGSVPVEVRGGGQEGGGRMEIELNLGQDLEARILKKAGTQAVQINQAGMAQMRREVPGIVGRHQLRNG